MKLSLAIALFFAATFSEDAVPQAKSKQKAETTKNVQMVTVAGECTKLVHAGLVIEGCKNLLVNMNYSTGVSSYWFMTESTILSFSAMAPSGSNKARTLWSRPSRKSFWRRRRCPQ